MPRAHTTWIRHTRPSSDGVWPEHLVPRVLGWGENFGAALGSLVDSTDAVVYLELVQEVTDLEDTNQTGISLGPDLIAWPRPHSTSTSTSTYGHRWTE